MHTGRRSNPKAQSIQSRQSWNSLVHGLVVHDEVVVNEVEAVGLVLKRAVHLWGRNSTDQ